MDDFSVNRDVRAGDGFAYAGSGADEREERECFYCLDGWVYLGFEGEDENGEHVEEIKRVRCRDCGGSGTLDGL